MMSAGQLVPRPAHLPAPGALRLVALGLAGLVGLLGLALAGCGGGSGEGAVPRAGARDDRPWNLLLVTFDTTRADRIGCYGRERAETPNLDRLAADGVRFARAFSAVPITAPSHSTIHTGRYPLAHGVRDNGLFVLSDEQLTLAEILRERGYATAAAVGAYPLTARFGLDQGFDLFDDHLTGIYEDHLGVRAVPKERLFFDERRAAQVNEAILPWLTERAEERAGSGGGRPFFAWVHYFDPHQPFEPAPPYDQLFADSLYDGEIAYADSRLGFLLEHLERLGELDRTLVVMTADHGEGLGDHNEETHAILAYNSTLHVPLIVRPPGDFPARGTVVEERVGIIDLAPTILELLEVEVPEEVRERFQGHTLVPFWTEGRRPARGHRVRYAENLSPRLTHNWGELRVLFDGPMKYIHGPAPELFDLDDDPRELRDLAAERPEEAEAMRRRLEAVIRRWAVSGSSTTQPVDEEVRARLESLGYLQSSGSGGEVVVERLRSDGPAPRHEVGLINDLSAAKQLVFEGRGREALIYTERLLRSSPDNPLYLELRAVSLMQSGHLPEAWQMARELAEEGSLTEPVMLHLTWSQFVEGDAEVALDALERYLAAHDSARGSWILASMLRSSGETERARRALDRALEVDPGFAPARVDRAVAMAQAGEDGAEEEFRRALEDGPYHPQVHYNYGTFLLHGGSYDLAGDHFERAVALAPRYLSARLALVAARAAEGRRDAAEEAFGELRRVAPESSETARAAEMLAGP